jgi:hypothetical protein
MAVFPAFGARCVATRRPASRESGPHSAAHRTRRRRRCSTNAIKLDAVVAPCDSSAPRAFLAVSAVRHCHVVIVLALAVVVWPPGAAPGALPVYDKIVVVVEENHSLQSVLGSGAAPYLDSLAAGGARFTNMFAVTHPSQPNYLHLFSGAHQGVYDNDVPPALFTTANLGAAVREAGKSFVGYSESMPEVGFTGASADGGRYARRHNPWVNWQSTGGAHQLPPEVNQPFTAFPTDFATLPSLSIVVPNNDNNAHDGTLATMDNWLSTNLGAYATWAPAHNSLLVVVFDEDDFSAANRIPLVFYGAHVTPGSVEPGTLTAHNLLRTLSDLTGAAPPAAAARVQPIVAPFAGSPAARTLSFRQGAAGYFGARDTEIDPANPTADHAADVALGGPGRQMLVKFDGLVGVGAQLVPSGAQILSAKLLLHTIAVGAEASLRPMIAPWTDAASWDSLVSGVSTDGSEAATTAEFSLLPNVSSAPAIFDVTASVQAWADGAPNQGWLLSSPQPSVWQFASSEASLVDVRPTLEVTYAVPGLPADFNNDGAVNAADLNVWKTKYPAAAGADADGDADVDGNDFLAWQRALTVATPPGAATPEPVTSTLLLVAVVATIGRFLRAGQATPSSYARANC